MTSSDFLFRVRLRDISPYDYSRLSRLEKHLYDKNMYWFEPDSVRIFMEEHTKPFYFEPPRNKQIISMLVSLSLIMGGVALFACIFPSGLEKFFFGLFLIAVGLAILAKFTQNKITRPLYLFQREWEMVDWESSNEHFRLPEDIRAIASLGSDIEHCHVRLFSLDGNIILMIDHLPPQGRSERRTIYIRDSRGLCK